MAMAVAMGIGRFFYTPLLPLMQRQLHFGPDVAGLIASVNFIGYFLGSVSAAFIPRGPMRLLVFRVALVASILTTFATGLTESATFMARSSGNRRNCQRFRFFVRRSHRCRSAHRGWKIGVCRLAVWRRGCRHRAFGTASSGRQAAF